MESSNPTLTPKTPLEHVLRGGSPPWAKGTRLPPRAAVTGNFACEVLVVGAGITGALIVEHLTSLGHQVCVIDRERPGFASTAASTAMLQWEIDCSLTELTQFYGFERAAKLYRKSRQAVAGLTSLVATLGLACDFRERNSLYLAGLETVPSELLAEHRLRERAGLPGDYLDFVSLKREFGLDRRDAILSSGCADANPLALSRAMLQIGATRGATLLDAEATQYEQDFKRVYVSLDCGHVIEAQHVVLATGYQMPDVVKTQLHRTASSWAIATIPQHEGKLWRDGVLIWEASDPYLYARTTCDNRIIIGGEDQSSVVDPDERDGLMPAKKTIIQRKLAELLPQADTEAEFVWSGAFGETEDGLPLIGPVPGSPLMFAAYGYGGNGITFSFLASRMIAQLVAGARQNWFDDFALDRPPPGA